MKKFQATAVPKELREYTTSGSLTGTCISPKLYQHVEAIHKLFNELHKDRNLDMKLVQRTLEDFYSGRPLDRSDDPAGVCEVVREMFNIVEFVFSACEIYRSAPGLPARVAIGVHNSRYARGSAVAFLENPVTLDSIGYYAQTLEDLRNHDYSKRQADSFHFVMTEVMVSAWPILHQMVKLKFRSVKVADRKLWIF